MRRECIAAHFPCGSFVGRCIPALLKTASVMSERKGHGDLALHPIGALGCLLREPDSMQIFEDNDGTTALLPFLVSPSSQARQWEAQPGSTTVLALRRRAHGRASVARRVSKSTTITLSTDQPRLVLPQVRRVAVAALYFVTSLSPRSCIKLANNGAIPILAELALNKFEPTAVRASALLALGCCVNRTAEGWAQGVNAPKTEGSAVGFDLPPTLLEQVFVGERALAPCLGERVLTGV